LNRSTPISLKNFAFLFLKPHKKELYLNYYNALGHLEEIAYYYLSKFSGIPYTGIKGFVRGELPVLNLLYTIKLLITKVALC
jgi:hypothetical protein